MYKLSSQASQGTFGKFIVYAPPTPPPFEACFPESASWREVCTEEVSLGYQRLLLLFKLSSLGRTQGGGLELHG